MLITFTIWSSFIAALSNVTQLNIFFDNDPSVVLDLTAQRHIYQKKTEIDELKRETDAIVVYWNSRAGTRDDEFGATKELGEYELQYWKRSFFAPFLPADGSITIKDTYVVLNGLSLVDTIGFRVRRRKPTWMLWKWLDDRDWGPWSDEVFVPPTNQSNQTNSCASLKKVATSLFHGSLFCLLALASLAMVGYELKNCGWASSRINLANRTIQKLRQQIAVLKEDLEGAESEVKSLLRLKGWGISNLGVDELQRLENELEESLKIVRLEKAKLITEATDRHLCVICYAEDKSILLLPCRHLCVCKKCSSQPITSCPICRSKISSAISVYAY